MTESNSKAVVAWPREGTKLSARAQAHNKNKFSVGDPYPARAKVPHCAAIVLDHCASIITLRSVTDYDSEQRIVEVLAHNAEDDLEKRSLVLSRDLFNVGKLG